MPFIRLPWPSLWKKLFLGRLVDFDEIPGPGLQASGDSISNWHSKTDTPWFDLVPTEGRHPAGWVLLSGRLTRRGSDYTARLRLDMGDGFESGPAIEPPITVRGTLLEVVYLPAGIRHMRFEPMQSPGDFEKTSLTMTELGWLARVVYMVIRVATMLRSQPRDRLSKLGLSAWGAFRDLKHAYHLAGLLRHYSPHISYASWCEQFDTLSSTDMELIHRHIQHFQSRPEIHMLVTLFDQDLEALRLTLDSLQPQIYRDFRVSILDLSESSADTALTETLVQLAHGQYVPTAQVSPFLAGLNDDLASHPMDKYVAFLRAGDQLSPHAMYWIASEAQDKRGAALIYTDDDEMTASGERLAPRFKPDWSPEHLRSTNYVGKFAVFRGRETDFIGGILEMDCRGDGYPLLLRMSEVLSAELVRHIPAVLYHRRQLSCTSTPAAENLDVSDVQALAGHLVHRGIRAEIIATRPGCRRLRYALPDKPLRVSILVPSRDQVALLRQCVESVLTKTNYFNYEILVVDNQSNQSETLAYLETLAGIPRVRVLRYDLPFNFSAINNYAAEQADGDILCLLNNDTEVISPDWLEEMLGHLVQHDVGVVGAKLLYPDGRVQHGGDAVGPGGCADHLHSMIDGDASGYCNRALVAQELSAVTAACLLTWKGLYRQLGGLNDRHLKVAFNDVDYCLRAWEAGYRVIWTPHARLYHHESATRGQDNSPEKLRRNRMEADYIRKRWPDRMQHDPFYSPNLSYERPDFSLSRSPRVNRPWLE